MNVFGAAELYVQRKIAKMASCMNGVESVKKNAPDAEVVVEE